jgi:transcription antitermination factor NusG
MKYTDTDILWYVLHASNGKAVKIIPYLEEASIKYFFPVDKEAKTSRPDKSERVPSLLGNLIFAKSSKKILDAVLNEVKMKLSISSDLYIDYGDKIAITIPEHLMRNFIAIAENGIEQVRYFSNEEVICNKGEKVIITGGAFEGVEGVFMRINGNRRLVVTIPNLFSVATDYIPVCYVQKIESDSFAFNHKGVSEF